MKLPNRNFAQPGALSATLVVPVRSTESPRTRPCTANSVPSVTMSDGTAVRMTRRPLMSPTTTPSASDAAMPTMIGAPK